MCDFWVKVKKCRPYYDVQLNDERYFTADNLRDALKEAVQLQELIQEIYDNAWVVPIDIDLD